MPEKALKKLNSYILPQWRACFLAAILVGLMAHLYKITGWLPNWDSLVFRYDPQNMIGLGRWFLPVACAVTSFYDLPFLNGIIAIVLHSICAVLICKLLNIRSKVTAALIGAVIVSFPTVTSVMMYNYVADGYSVAFLFSTLAALFMTQEKPKYILSAILIAFSLGIYQAYITVTIMLILISLIGKIFFQKIQIKSLWKNIGLMLITGIGGAALYYGILKLLLSFSSATLLDYQGIGSTFALSNIDLLASLYTIKETFIKCFFDISNGVNFYVVLNILIFLITAFFYIKYLIKNKLYKSPLKMITAIFISAILIVGAGVLAFINAQIDYHNLMLMGYSVFYIFLLLVYEKGTERKEKSIAIKRWIVLGLALLVVANQIVIANVSYHKAQMAYEKSYGVLVRIADRIEQTEKAEECSEILVIGALDDSKDYSVNLTPNITGITDGYILRYDDETVNQSVLCSALNDYCGKNYSFISGKEKRTLESREDIKALGKWPAKDSIAVVEDIIVIKLG